MRSRFVMLIVFTLSILMREVPAASLGSMKCDATVNYGCSNWTDIKLRTDKSQCQDENPGEMWWVKNPVRSPFYTVRTGDTGLLDPKSYVPGEIMSIYVRVTEYEWKYRGLLIHAVNDIDETVGSWSVPMGYHSYFWSPPWCPDNSVLSHTSASIKPFLAELRFIAPPKGTGTITFRTLIKRGPANEGEFYYPVQDLSLSEANTSPTPQKWFIAPKGQSCDDYCQSLEHNIGFVCDVAHLTDIESAEKFKYEVGRHHACSFPAIKGCWDMDPMINDQGLCWYRDKQCSEFNCTTSNPSYSRFCKCILRSSDPSTSGSTSFFQSAFLIIILVLSNFTLMTFSRTGNHARGTLIVLISIPLLSKFCDAHNWVHTPGRAYTQASTVKPCRGRKTTDTHVQVKPNQEFAYKWATGHGGPTYITVIAGQYYEWLAHSDFIDMVNDYIENAPAGSNYALEENWKRLHGATSDIDYLDVHRDMVVEKIEPGSDKYIHHPHEMRKGYTQYTYNPDWIANDIRVSYKSDKYPWLESAYKIGIPGHLPGDYSAIRMDIKARSGPGHYIVHYRWNGYYDCTDVDVRPENELYTHSNGLQLKDVEHLYGQEGVGYIYNRIDHCQYINPKSIQTTCLDASVTAQPCLDLLNARNPRANERPGVNVIPFSNPISVYSSFQKQKYVNIPWADSTCVGSAWTLIPGTITTSTVWENWKSTRMIKLGKCSELVNGGASLTIDDAVTLCSDAECLGITWQGETDIPSNPIYRCSSTTIDESEGTWKTAIKNIPSIATINNEVELTISFHPSNLDVQLPANTYSDTGEVFGDRGNGLKYGWNCDSKNFMKSYDFKYPTHENTYVLGPKTLCPNNMERVFELEVSNGAYEVTAYVEYPRHLGVGSCTFENMPMGYGTGNFPYCNSKTPCSSNEICNSRGFCSPTNGGCIIYPNQLFVGYDMYDYVPQVTSSKEQCCQLCLDTSGCQAWGWNGNKDNKCYLKRGIFQFQFNTGPDNVGDFSGYPGKGGTTKNTFQVDDGRLTFTTGTQGHCTGLTYFSFKKVAERMQPAWPPSGKDPWIQIELETSSPIGLVHVKPWSYHNCARDFLFAGNVCYPRPAGFWHNFSDSNNAGFLVGVSDQPCTTTSNKCSGEVCNHTSFTLGNMQDYYVNCNGKKGKYVWLQLPGSNRIASVQLLEVNRYIPTHLPLKDIETPMVCYGLLSRTQTQTQPEYIISDDPEDPIFYSTCYVREKNRTWMDAKITPPEPRWRFNSRCLSCANYDKNVINSPQDASIIRWELTDKNACVDCNRDPVSSSPSSSFTWHFAFSGRKCDYTNSKVAGGAKCANVNCEYDPAWHRDKVLELECKVLAEKNPMCAGTFITYNFKLQKCLCLVKSQSECCKCRPVSQNSHNIFERSAITTIDAACNKGVLSADNTTCCAVECEGYCDTREANRKCLDGIAACCGDGLEKNCNHSGPPCRLNTGNN